MDKESINLKNDEFMVFLRIGISSVIEGAFLSTYRIIPAMGYQFTADSFKTT